MKDQQIEYRFVFEDGSKFSYTLVLDGKTLSLKSEASSEPALWTKLENHKCSVCPLSSDTHPHCPIAKNLHKVGEDFKNYMSIDQVRVIVKTEERTYFKRVDMQEGLFSIFGIIMSTSGCPIMGFLKPMARFHLPFASVEETIIRSTSFHLLRQYFAKQRGESVAVDFEGLNEKYELVFGVNEGMSNRLKSIAEGDADRNAVVILSTFGQLIQMNLKDNLGDLAYLFVEHPENTSD